MKGIPMANRTVHLSLALLTAAASVTAVIATTASPAAARLPRP